MEFSADEVKMLTKVELDGINDLQNRCVPASAAVRVCGAARLRPLTAIDGLARHPRLASSRFPRTGSCARVTTSAWARV